MEGHNARQGPCRDDPAVLPPVLRGQLSLFPVRHQLSIQVCRRILQRPLDGYDELVEHTAAFAADTGIGKPMQRKLVEMLRLALAVRDADGDDLVDERVLGDIPNFTRSVRAILQRAEILRPEPLLPPLYHRAPNPRPRPTQRRVHPLRAPTQPDPTPRSCILCDCWFTASRRGRCLRCTQAGGLGAAAAICGRCRRPAGPLVEGRCRGCHIHIAVHGPGAEHESFTQLWFGEPLPTGLALLRRPATSAATEHGGRPVSEHLAFPGQQALFEARRDWRRLAYTPAHLLPSLTPAAETLLAELASQAQRERWEKGPVASTRQTLTILLSWLGSNAPVRETDLHDLAQTKEHLSARRAARFLHERGLLIVDPNLHRDSDQDRVERELAAFPETIGRELRAWVRAVRGEGRWERPGRSYHSIARYVGVLKPVLDRWIDNGIDSLRTVTRQDIEEAIATRTGTPARAIHIVLRNVFRALRQERLIFRDPTRGLVFSGITTVPPSIPSDRLAGLLDRARSAFDHVVIILVCVHALNGTDIRRLLLSDLDLPRERLLVRRPGRRHVIYLDETTYHSAAEWTRERHRRWPASANLHLLINRWTAVDPNAAITTAALHGTFQHAGVSMQTARQDRILHEAHETEDPLHLIRLFGISATTAMRYITAAHPERTAKLLL